MLQLGKYQLIRKLATGGMAEVFLARVAGPMGFQKRLVVKRILPHFAGDPQFIQMFLAEAKLAAELNHPNIVQIFDFGKEGNTYYLAMEFIDGPNLRVLSKRFRQRGQQLPLHLCAKIISYACEGLAYAHDFQDPETGRPLNLIHRDISPDNIILSRSGTVKVVDFGIAKSSTRPRLTQSGVVKGKMAYMPPEQLSRQAMDRRVDVFALGVVFYELVSGRMPFDATSEVSIIQALMSPEPLLPISGSRPDVPEVLQRIIHRALEKNPADRYPSCRDLQADIEQYLLRSGTTVQPRDLAEMVTALEDTAVVSAKATPANGSSPDVQPGAARTVPPGGSDPGMREDTAPFFESAEDAVADTLVRRDPDDVVVTEPQETLGRTDDALRAVRRSRLPMVAVGLGLVLLGAAGAYVLLEWRSAPGPGQGPAPAEQGAGTAVANQGTAMAPGSPPMVPAPGASPPAPIPSPAAPSPAAPPPASAAAPSEGPSEPPAGSAQERSPGKSGRGTLVFRIRPYAQVYLDGKLLGQTPIAPASVPVGRHTIRLVNAKLGKDLELPVVVRANQETVFKYNLKE